MTYNHAPFVLMAWREWKVRLELRLQLSHCGILCSKLSKLTRSFSLALAANTKRFFFFKVLSLFFMLGSESKGQAAKLCPFLSLASCRAQRSLVTYTYSTCEYMGDGGWAADRSARVRIECNTTGRHLRGAGRKGL